MPAFSDLRVCPYERAVPTVVPKIAVPVTSPIISAPTIARPAQADASLDANKRPTPATFTVQNGRPFVGLSQSTSVNRFQVFSAKDSIVVDSGARNDEVQASAAAYWTANIKVGNATSAAKALNVAYCVVPGCPRCGVLR
jgi:hypothetical protein